LLLLRRLLLLQGQMHGIKQQTAFSSAAMRMTCYHVVPLSYLLLLVVLLLLQGQMQGFQMQTGSSSAATTMTCHHVVPLLS
jgi:hypothetical protein